MPPTSAASSRPIFGRIVGQCSVQLWGLDAAERLRRQLAALGVTRVLGAEEAAPPKSAVLLVRADFLFDQRSLNALAAQPGVALRTQLGRPVAAHVEADQDPELAALLSADRPVAAIPGVALETVDSLSSAYVQTLLKADRPMLLRVRPEQRALLERHLFDGSYKGITDFVTKWLWPAPAAACVRWCVRWGIPPNAVTGTSVLLVLLALGLFAGGWFGTGLVLGWWMTFLDTVDGKLARVTLTSSRLGHALDKGLDIVHPPLWYIAFAYGASGVPFGSPPTAWVIASAIWILAGYIGGRLLEGAFDFYLGKFPVYSWRPIDSWARLVIARRNPNLVWLSAFWLLGDPAAGVDAVVWWTAASTAFLAVRLAQAAAVRAGGGENSSWLKESDSPGFRHRLTSRTFSSASPRVRAGLESSERND